MGSRSGEENVSAATTNSYTYHFGLFSVIFFFSILFIYVFKQILGRAQMPVCPKGRDVPILFMPSSFSSFLFLFYFIFILCVCVGGGVGGGGGGGVQATLPFRARYSAVYLKM